MKIINKIRSIAKTTYQFIKLIPTEAKVGAVASVVGSAAVSDGIITGLTDNAVKGVAKSIGGIGLITIGSTMINNGIEKMSHEEIADFYEKCAEDLGAWIDVDDNQIADSVDITDIIDHDQF